jgi:hypothetical protein
VTAERRREVPCVAIADEARDVVHRERALLNQELRADRQAPRAQILAEARVAELLIRTLDLAGRARQRAGNDRECQLAPVVACDDHAREQVQPLPGGDGVGTHTPHSDRCVQA